MPRARAQRSTIHDVARLAGVSYQTVSRVVNGHVNVAEATRSRVASAIRELNYQPNITAKSLATRSSQLLGLIAYGTEQYGPAQVVQTVERSARAHGYEVLLTSLNTFAVTDIAAAIRRLSQFGVDGLILLAPYDALEVARSMSRTLPFIMIDATRDVDCTTVSIDQEAGGALATEHLIALGHRRILHVSGPAEWTDAELRDRGYRRAMRTHGLDALPRAEGNWSAESGHRAVQGALEAGTAFTAIVAANDQMALGALSALRAAGRRVPEDVSVIGFDNTPESAYYAPGLTTVAQDYALLGRTSIEELLRVMAAGEAGTRHVVFRPQLVLRASTAPPGG